MYAEMLSEVLIEKAVGNDEIALEKLNKMCNECGKYELQFENYYDHGLIFRYTTMKVAAKTVAKVADAEI